ncbi:TonB-dependent receptor plug domain-containing protein [Luteimonas arsenica]|uniref:TonB-dependent receptor plug domain-containing protein n=1 Tax=Luteimonas arsenica TaxID=1586242 RepID=UPI001A9E9D58|nr:TonB-dependent receptor [Luteimonas arsenica]
MTEQSRNGLKPNSLSVALVAALTMSVSGLAMAQEATEDESTTTSSSATTLDRVTVTGSLIPQTEIETFTPVTVITAEDIQARGFTSVSDVLQKSSFATGGVQGAQSSASFTQGAETVSLFGLPPGYVKYLIDGRPMANYPALYNGSDTFNNISGIPIDLIERIEILPGGQSSLYGSDAIAGVINIILKKRMDGVALNIRGGGYSEGGGNSFRASVATGFSAADDRLNILLGGQYEDRSAIWGYQRDMTSTYFDGGQGARPASRDFLVHSPFTSYKWLDPNNCSNVEHLFDGGEGMVERPGFGDGYYCGSYNSPGYRTLLNAKEATQAYGNLTFDINDSTQLYASALYSRETVKYHVGSNYTWWGTGPGWGYYFDPRVGNDIATVYGEYFCGEDPDPACLATLPSGSYLGLQRAFAPEDMGPGGFNNSMQQDKSESTRVTLGINGTFGESAWDYDIGYTRTDYKLNEHGWVRWAEAMNNYFQDRVLGPQLGVDPLFGAYPIFEPDYAAFYQPISPEDFAAMTGYAVSRSKTVDEMVRAQVTNASLFGLPGGDAGIAVALEYGQQSWDYTPHPGYLNGDIWGTTAVAGGGDRDRYAVVTELRMPVLDPLTVTLAGRYDSFKASGRTIDKPTYSLGLEWRPSDTLLLRGKYGTAFRSPTLSDLYQGESGYYTFVTDYYNCAQLGFEPGDTTRCPAAFSNRQVFGIQEGSTELDPINADVWSAGVVWAPIDRMSFSLDYHSWDIEDEVTQQSPDSLLLQEYRCRTGLEDINSMLCQMTLSQITRGATGNVNEIYTPKVNVSRQTLEALTAGVNYAFDAGVVGEFNVRANYTQKLNHEYQQYAEDPMVDMLRSPWWTSDPQRKADASLTWMKNNWSSTLYANWTGATPNYRARVIDGYGEALSHKIGSFTTYNATVTWAPIEKLSFSVLVNNVFNKMPPIDDSYPNTSGAPYNSSVWNVYGRAFYLEARYHFGR